MIIDDRDGVLKKKQTRGYAKTTIVKEGGSNPAKKS
jgi:hypothetical protein